jgi:hypothetical protein
MNHVPYCKHWRWSTYSRMLPCVDSETDTDVSEYSASMLSFLPQTDPKDRGFSEAVVNYLRVKAASTSDNSKRTSKFTYRVIKKFLCTWWLQYRKLEVMFKVSPASLQTFIDTPNCVLEDRVQYSTVHIPNVFCDGHLQIINCVGTVRKQWVRCTETFWSPCSFLMLMYH